VAAEAEWRWCVRALYAVRLDRLAAAGDADALPAYLIEWWTAGRLRCGMGCWVGLTQACCMLGLFWNFLYLFYHDFAKIYGPAQILQKCTSGAVAHGVRDITPRAAALGATRSGP
jgi:hypothetical protein